MPDQEPNDAYLIEALLLLIVTANGCALNATRWHPITPLEPPSVNLSQTLKERMICVIPFESTPESVTGSHHEGLLQVRQHGIFGLSQEQRTVLYQSAPTLAVVAFASELKRQGTQILMMSNNSGQSFQSVNCRFLLSGLVELIDLNTFGRGTIEGFGSAGNYWEATVKFKDVQLKDLNTQKSTKVGGIQAYAKLEPSPATLNWTMLTVVLKSLQEGAQGYLNTWQGEYSIEPHLISPIEVAARYAAFQFLQRVQLGEGVVGAD